MGSHRTSEHVIIYLITWLGVLIENYSGPIFFGSLSSFTLQEQGLVLREAKILGKSRTPVA